MKIKILAISLILASMTFTSLAMANVTFPSFAMNHDGRGHIDSVNLCSHSFTLNGKTFYATESTRYRDGLKGFADLHPGQKVEVHYDLRDGRSYASKIELN